MLWVCGEAKTAYHQMLQGRTEETRRAFRRAILEVTPDQVIQAAATYHDKDPSMAVVTSMQNEDLLSSEFVGRNLSPQ